MTSHETPQPPAARSSWQLLLGRVKAWLRHTPLDGYWLDQKYLVKAVQSLAPQSTGTLLDIGAAERQWDPLFAPYVDRHVGVEYPPSCENLTTGVSQWDAQDLGVVDLWCDGCQLPFKGESFDTALCIEVLEHVPEPDKVVSEAARVLKPGGRFLVTVPFTVSLHAVPFDFYRYTPHGLTALLERHGFLIESLTPRGNYPAVAGAVLGQYLLRGIGARRFNTDGSVSLSWWRAPLVLPLIALVQCLFAVVARFSRDENACLGYAVVARRPVEDDSSS